MTTRSRAAIVGLLVIVVLTTGTVAAFVTDDDQRGPESVTSTTADSSATSSSVLSSTTTALATTTTEPPVVWPAVAGDGVARAVRTPGGIVLAVREVRADGSYLAVSPFGNDVVVPGEAISGPHGVRYPCHGPRDTRSEE